MASSATAQAPPAPPAQPDWLTLPLELLQRCLGHLEDERAAFSACKQFTRAVLLNSLQQEQPARLRWDVGREEPVEPSARLVQALLGEQGSKGVALVLFSTHRGSPARCMAELRASGAALTCITRLEMQNLLLDTLIADAVPAFLPNLRQLRISNCQLTAVGATSLVDAECGTLQHVEVEGLRGDRTHTTIQLLQLAGLPSLSSVSLLDSTCPTQFLNILSTRLTALHLDSSYRQVEEGTDTPTPVWRATLRHATRCTALQSLAIPCSTSEELGLVAPALQQLRRLHLNWPYGVAVDGDAMVERLLGLPHLTSLTWEDISGQTFRRSHASSPCRWRELGFRFIAPHQLASLPLHSLTSPVAWEVFIMDHEASVAEVQAAVDNVARRCPLSGVWRKPPGAWWPGVQFLPPTGSDTFTRGAGEGDTPPVLLRALRPLLAAPDLRQLGVTGLAWDVEVVKALGEALPHACTGLALQRGSLALPACMQLAVSIPWVHTLRMIDMSLHPQGVTAYVGAAAGRLQGAGVGPALESVRVERPVRPEGRSEESWREAWEEVRHAVQGLGVGVQLELEW